MNNFYRRVSIIFSLLILTGCASQGSPPGGPEDETPPSVVYMYPADGTTEVPGDVELEVEFSEYLNSASVRPSIFISPYTGIDPEITVRRRTVEIDFAQPLQDNTTYIVNFGTAITDLRGNRLPQSISLAFSTGPVIDQGVMAGRLYSREAPQGNLTVLAYQQSDVPVDSLIKRRPDYRSNPDERGIFQFDNLQTGEYFFLGILDENNNSIYDPGEWTGIPSRPYWQVRDSLTTLDLQMQLFQYPADSLILTMVEQANRHQITVGFNRPPADTVSDANLIFVSSEEDTLYPAAVMAGESEGEYLLEHYDTVPDSTYLFLARNLTGPYGLPFAFQRDRRDVEISARQDTLPLQEPTISIGDSTTDVSQSTPLVIQWERAVRQLPPDSVLLFTGADSDTFRLRWQDERTLLASPDSLWPAETWFSWTLYDSMISDLRDSTYSDSLTSGSFQIEPGTEYGSLSGNVTNLDSSWNLQRMKVQAQQYANGAPVDDMLFQETVAQDTSFYFERVPPGDYRLEVYHDSDSSNTYTYGRPFPFESSENFVIFQDSINVRPRWETSGITIRFPESTR